MQMKNVAALSLTLLILAVATTGCSNKAGTNGTTAYGFRSAAIEFSQVTKSFGTIKSISKKVWIDQFGESIAIQCCTQTNYSPLGYNTSSEICTLDIIRDNTIYKIDLSKKKGVSAHLPSKENSNATYSLLPIYTDYTIKQNDGTFLRYDTLINLPCRVYTVWDNTVWVYKGIALKTESVVLGERVVETATSFCENCTIDSTVFRVPTGIALQKSLTAITQ